jgi:predicted glycosyltransferase
MSIPLRLVFGIMVLILTIYLLEPPGSGISRGFNGTRNGIDFHTRKMAMNLIRKVFVYTHNAIGLGHLFRILAVMTGMRKWRPDIDFLVISGSSVPHIVLRQGIEVIKLPSIKRDLEAEGSPLTPRYLKRSDLKEVLAYRKRAIMEAFQFFHPDVVMIEHYLAGLAEEVAPLFAAKEASRFDGTKEFTLVNLSRGIMGGLQPGIEPGPQSPLARYLGWYDFFYLFDDRTALEGDTGFLGQPLPSEPKVHFLGKITEKTRDEILSRPEVLSRFSLSGKPIILISLSRHGDIVGLSRSLMAAFHRTGLNQAYQIIIIIDPYLDPIFFQDLRDDPMFKEVRFLPFVYPLVDLIHTSELVICRAGYNTVNEVLLTDSRALIIPEHHPSGEQERRAEISRTENTVVASEQAILSSPPDGILLELLSRTIRPMNFDFDKYRIGKEIIVDLEKWAEVRTPSISTLAQPPS